MNYELDQLLGTYADWIAWLKEKESSLEGQLARMRGKAAESREQLAGGGKPEAVSEVPAGEMPFEAEDTPSPPAITDNEAHPSVAEDDEEDDWL